MTREREGEGCEWYKKCLKDPGPLKSIKPFSATTQQFMCSDRIMWPPPTTELHVSGFILISVEYIDNRGQFLIPYFVYFSRILYRSGVGGILSMVFLFVVVYKFGSGGGGGAKTLGGEGVRNPKNQEGPDNVVLSV